MRLMVRQNRESWMKYSVDISPKLIRELGWPDHVELEGVVKGDTLLLRPKGRKA